MSLENLAKAAAAYKVAEANLFGQNVAEYFDCVVREKRLEPATELLDDPLPKAITPKRKS